MGALAAAPRSIFSSDWSIFCANSDGSEILLSGDCGTIFDSKGTITGFMIVFERCLDLESDKVELAYPSHMIRSRFFSAQLS